MPLKFKEIEFGFIHKNDRCLIISIDLKTCCIASFFGYNFNTGLMTSEFINVMSIKSKDIENGIISFNPTITKGTIKTNKYSVCNYYIISSQKEKIQDAMEKRAVNKILQRITGDESFVY
jgi:hypothetical protein